MRRILALVLALVAAPAAAQEVSFDPTRFHTLFLDFDAYAATDWVITTTEGGTSSATEALTDAEAGRLVVTNDTYDDDADFFQWAGGAGNAIESFTFDSAERLYFKAKFQVSESAQSDFNFGLQVTDTTPLAVSDGIWFGKDDGDSNVDFHVAASSTQTDVAAVCTVDDATDITLAFYYAGDSRPIRVWCDDVLVGSAPITNAPSTELVLSFGFANGESNTDAAGGDSVSVDYLFVARER